MKRYIIPQGEYRSVWFPRFHAKGHDFTLNVKFNSSCQYRVQNDEIHILCGYSYGFLNPRGIWFGWRWIAKERRVELWAVTEDLVGRTAVPLHKCRDTSEIKIIVRRLWFAEGWKWMINVVDDSLNYMAYMESPDKIPDYGEKILPFFDGDTAATHDIEIWTDC